MTDEYGIPDLPSIGRALIVVGFGPYDAPDDVLTQLGVPATANTRRAVADALRLAASHREIPGTPWQALARALDANPDRILAALVRGADHRGGGWPPLDGDAPSGGACEDAPPWHCATCDVRYPSVDGFEGFDLEDGRGWVWACPTCDGELDDGTNWRRAAGVAS